jgi:nucleoside-diphosphate-sugar epimerase
MKLDSIFLPSPSGELKGALMQPGDVPKTEASVTDLMEDLGYKPSTPIEKGIESFIDWYKSYFGIK